LSIHEEELEKILREGNLWILKPRISESKIAKSIIEGMTRNLMLREIRQTYLSKRNLEGWKIENYGDHPVKLKDKKQVIKSISILSKLIKSNVIPKDIKNEFVKYIKR